MYVEATNPVISQTIPPPIPNKKVCRSAPDLMSFSYMSETVSKVLFDSTAVNDNFGKISKHVGINLIYIFIDDYNCRGTVIYSL